MRPALRKPIRGLVLLLLAATICGCGSKISQANYYRVQYGMTEKEVEDLLGPAHAESAGQPAGTKVKSWTRETLTLRVEFRDGVVVGRSADGIPAEAPPRVAARVKT